MLCMTCLLWKLVPAWSFLSDHVCIQATFCSSRSDIKEMANLHCRRVTTPRCSPCSAKPCLFRSVASRGHVVRALDGVPGMSDGNCITEASARSIIAGATGGTSSSPKPQVSTGGPSGGNSGGSPGSGGGGSGGSGGAGNSGGSGSSPNSGSHPMRLWTFLLAALVGVGGSMGYIRRGSTGSMAGGLSAAFVLALAANSMAGPNMMSGARVAFAVTLLLGIFFLSRFVRSKKVFPAGVGAGLSLTYAAAFVATGL